MINLPKDISGYYKSLSAQEIALLGLNHTYAYVDSNPVTNYDIFGLLGYPKGPSVPPSGITHPFGGPMCGSGWSEHFVPDRGLFGMDYTEACKKHDECYAKCGSKRWECDADLALGTHNILYMIAVRLAGRGAYNDAQKESHCNSCDK